MLSGKLPVGIGYAFKSNPGSSVAYCALTTRCGTRRECGLFPEGTAHFVEHAIFKGTVHRSAEEINATLDSLGGELNAYTTKEEIVLHATSLKEDLDTALSLLVELAAEATFPKREIETERGVVLDEIISYEDAPSDDIYDRFEKLLFEGHPLGRLILGTGESVGRITREDLVGFYTAFFRPENMVVSIVADMPEEKMLSLLESKCKLFSSTCSAADSSLCTPCIKNFTIEEKRSDHEANAVIGALAPSLYDGRKRIAAVLLANILGGPASNSLLGKELRERNGWVYGVECCYTQYSDTGVMAVSLGCDKKNLSKCIEAVARIVEDFITVPMPGKALAAAKRQILGQLAISSDSGETQCLSMGKSMLSFGKVSSDEENKAMIESVTSDELSGLCAEIFAHPSQLIYK